MIKSIVEITTTMSKSKYKPDRFVLDFENSELGTSLFLEGYEAKDSKIDETDYEVSINMKYIKESKKENISNCVFLKDKVIKRVKILSHYYFLRKDNYSIGYCCHTIAEKFNIDISEVERILKDTEAEKIKEEIIKKINEKKNSKNKKYLLSKL
jgi:hypothetical protein